jgi:catechol 1,2-dioxygenase
MTTDQTLESTEAASAAASGASATERFAADKSPFDAVKDTPPERVDRLAKRVLNAVYDTIREEKVSYDEYNALKAWLIQVGKDGEWPLFLDVWVEHEVEKVATEHREGNKGTIEGPYYVPAAPEQGANGTIPMRDGEAGTPLAFQGTVTDLDGAPLDGALVELWHADDDGYYSQFAPGIPEWNLRGQIRTAADGRFLFRTIQPAPYQIPTDGATGAFVDAAGWHPWRPAHLHLKVSAPGRQLVTTQLYFDGGDFVADDVAQAVKPELVLRPTPAASGSGNEVTYDFPLDPAA